MRRCRLYSEFVVLKKNTWRNSPFVGSAAVEGDFVIKQWYCNPTKTLVTCAVTTLGTQIRAKNVKTGIIVVVTTLY